MNYIYNFDEISMPLWIYYLYWWLYFIPFLFFFFRLVLNRKKIIYSSNASICFILYFTIYVVLYCIGDDYFVYRDWIFGRDFTFWGKEWVYVFIITFCRQLPFNYPYEAFRLIVWGGAIILVYFSAWQYRKQLCPGLVILFLFVLYSSSFCYARASLAMSVYIVGVSLFLNNKGFFKKLLAICVAISSYFFHHELIIGIGLLFCLFVPFEKKKGIRYLFVFLIFSLVILSYLLSNPDIFDTIFESDYISNKIEDFSNREQRIFRISTLVLYLTFYIPTIMFVVYLRKGKRVSNSIIGLYRITCGIIIFATVFGFVAGARSTFAYRVLFVSMLPISMIMAYFYNIGYIKKYQLIAILILALLSNSVSFINS